MSTLKESKFEFPDPRVTLEDGLLCVGGDLEAGTLHQAYSKGVFPWPQEGFPLLWFSPPLRGVLFFKELHLSKSLKKFMRKTEYSVRVDTAFDEVIEECAKFPRPGQDGTWILPEMLEAYKRFHQAGYAHSFEIYQRGRLVGGLYGVYVGGVFSGESMFYRRPNMSKVALVETIRCLQATGLKWMDIQMVTPHLEAMGGKYVDRDEFLELLSEAKDLPLFPREN